MLSDFTVVHNTVTFANIPRRGRMLILSHRDELVRQPRKYFDCSFAIEQGPNHAGRGAEIVSASVPSIVRRLKSFDPDEFDIIIVDEAHHAAAPSYRKIMDYFCPRLLLGFTATPNRADGIGLDAWFDDIIFERDLEWGIKNGYLADIYCLRVDIGYDLRDVATRLGDYSSDDLDKACNIQSANQAVADAYRRYAKGQTLIFAVSVAHARAIAAEIPGAEVVVGGEDRTETLEKFRRGELRCIVNCMVFTEGTDLPNIETVMIVRPTQNVSLYTQMVGRGTRLFPGKDKLTLIDCVGASAINLCTAPSLLGIDASLLDPQDRLKNEDIFDLPDDIQRVMDTPKYWIRNAQIVNLWAKGRKYNLHGINFFRTARGDLILGKPKFILRAPDKLGRTVWNGAKVPYQRVLDEIYKSLVENHADTRNLWDAGAAKKWGEYRATDRQKEIIRGFLPDLDTEELTKSEAGAILTRFFLGRELR
ncbi:DEAD/DEAH box helicase [Cloacibacillus evryensis]|uniref:DEAD/DEAH box helicase n=1 Tax=Cloacibacillus evryensis TaxID=508460 RepID=UPI002B211E02|nr:DEAD/DEAH box helicase [Cloacibacillus evryensis]MEA5034206.1 DEAD/DEAH box helicase [Cloacibacillus evryensis]